MGSMFPPLLPRCCLKAPGLSTTLLPVQRGVASGAGDIAKSRPMVYCSPHDGRRLLWRCMTGKASVLSHPASLQPLTEHRRGICRVVVDTVPCVLLLSPLYEASNMSYALGGIAQGWLVFVVLLLFSGTPCNSIAMLGSDPLVSKSCRYPSAGGRLYRSSCCYCITPTHSLQPPATSTVCTCPLASCHPGCSGEP